jgi:hypothetical protein
MLTSGQNPNPYHDVCEEFNSAFFRDVLVVIASARIFLSKVKSNVRLRQRIEERGSAIVVADRERFVSRTNRTDGPAQSVRSCCKGSQKKASNKQTNRETSSPHSPSPFSSSLRSGEHLQAD